MRYMNLFNERKEGNQMTKVQKSWEKYLYTVLQVVTVLYGLLCLYLYYMQSIQPLDYDNRYFQSDLPYHISMIVEDGWYYSFTAYIYQILYIVCGRTTVGIAVFLAVVSVATVFLTDIALRIFLKLEKSTWYTLLGAISVNFIMPFFWEYAGLYRYVSYQSGSIWHNSTYQCMKLAALSAFLYYWKLQEKYKDQGITVKEWFVFCILLAVCTGIKPSFLTVFAPVMAVFLVADLFRKVSFKRIFVFGSAVLPSLGVILWQQSILFGEETGNGISIQPWYAFSLHAQRPKVAVLCSLAFPIVVLLFSLVDLWNDKKYLFLWLMTGVGFAEALLFVEVGKRSRDGNFLWGYSFAIFAVNLYSLVQMVKMFRKSKQMVWYKGMLVVCAAVFSYQVLCGVVFFARLLSGETYWMLG